MDEIMQQRIQEQYTALRPSEKKVAGFIMAYEGPYENLLMTDISRGAGVSQPTVIRFVKALGYRGFRELKNDLIKGQALEGVRGGANQSLPTPFGFKIRQEDGLDRIPGKAISASIQMLKETLQAISGSDYAGAVKAIAGASRVVLYGVEDSAATAYGLMAKLLYLGIPCCRYEDFYLQQASAGCLTGDELAIGISHSGRSNPTLEMMQKARRAKAATVVITNTKDSPISRYGDFVLCTGNQQFQYGDAIFSNLTQMAIVDMLYLGVLNYDYGRYRQALRRNSRMAAHSADAGPTGGTGVHGKGT